MSAVDDPMIGLIVLGFALLVCGFILLGRRPRAQIALRRSGETAASRVDELRP